MSKSNKYADAALRFDQQIVASWIEPESRVLDLGCGEGELLGHLVREKGVRGTGIDHCEDKVARCVAKGLSVIQGSINKTIPEYPDNAFDYVVVSQTLQQVYDPTLLLESLLRIGKKGIVSFPNFGYWRVRLQAMFSGHAPKTRELPYEWHDTPNIRVLTISDFHAYARDIPFRIIAQEAVTMPDGNLFPRHVTVWPNVRASYGIFMIEAGKR